PGAAEMLAAAIAADADGAGFALSRSFVHDATPPSATTRRKGIAAPRIDGAIGHRTLRASDPTFASMTEGGFRDNGGSRLQMRLQAPGSRKRRRDERRESK